MTGRDAARQIYARFHAAEANREIRVNVPTPKAAAALGVAKAIEYEVPADWPSEKAGVYRHEFGDTGWRDTGAKPLLVDLGDGNLLLTPAPGEERMTIEDRGIVG